MYFGLSRLVKGVDLPERRLMLFTLEAYMLFLTFDISGYLILDGTDYLQATLKYRRPTTSRTTFGLTIDHIYSQIVINMSEKVTYKVGAPLKRTKSKVNPK